MPNIWEKRKVGAGERESGLRMKTLDMGELMA